MIPEVERDCALGQKCNALGDPIWRTEPELMEGNSLLHVRHPGLGWLHFLIPKTEAEKLAGFLQAQVSQQPAQAPFRKN